MTGALPMVTAAVTRAHGRPPHSGHVKDSPGMPVMGGMGVSVPWPLEPVMWPNLGRREVSADVMTLGISRQAPSG